MNKDNKLDIGDTPQRRAKQSVYKAAEVCSEYQGACKEFFNNKTYETANDLIQKCDLLTEHQDLCGTTFVNKNSILHRKMVAQDWLEQTNQSEIPKDHSVDKKTGWVTYINDCGQKITKIS